MGSILVNRQKVLALTADASQLRYEMQAVEMDLTSITEHWHVSEHEEMFAKLVNQISHCFTEQQVAIPLPPVDSEAETGVLTAAERAARAAAAAAKAAEPQAPKLFADFGLRLTLENALLVEKILDGSAEGGVIATNPPICAWLRHICVPRQKAEVIENLKKEEKDGLKNAIDKL